MLLRRKGEGTATAKKTHISCCVSNKIKYLTPFARKIQRPLFTRSERSERSEQANEWFDCGLLRWNQLNGFGFGTYRIREYHTQSHKWVLYIVLKSHKFSERQATAPFCALLFGFLVSWFRCVSANASNARTLTQYAHTKCAHSPPHCARVSVSVFVAFISTCCAVKFNQVNQLYGSVIRARSAFFHQSQLLQRVELSWTQVSKRVWEVWERARVSARARMCNRIYCVVFQFCAQTKQIYRWVIRISYPTNVLVFEYCIKFYSPWIFYKKKFFCVWQRKQILIIQQIVENIAQNFLFCWLLCFVPCVFPHPHEAHTRFVHFIESFVKSCVQIEWRNFEWNSIELKFQ